MIARRSFLRTSILAASIPVIPAMAHAAPAVSPELTTLIDAYEQRTAELDALPEGDATLDRVAAVRMRAVDALLDYRPGNLSELAAKIDALKPFMAEDVDLVSLDVIADDVRALIEEDK
jgi:hypothetical protein